VLRASFLLATPFASAAQAGEVTLGASWGLNMVGLLMQMGAAGTDLATKIEKFVADAAAPAG
jgi:hypothetical protein